MRHLIGACCLALLLAAPAFADAPAVDFSKLGPGARLPKAEKQDQKELAEWSKAFEAAGLKGDLDTEASMIDFPLTMTTDTTKGEFKSSAVSKDQWLAMMKPYMTPDAIKAMKDMSTKYACFLMSDDLASCEGDVTMKMGKQKLKTRDHMFMSRVGGKWMAKSMTEAGWGDLHSDAPAAAAAPAPAPTK